VFQCNIITVIITYIMVFVDTVNEQDRWCRRHSAALANHLYARRSFIVITYRVVVVCDAVAWNKTRVGYRKAVERNKNEIDLQNGNQYRVRRRRVFYLKRCHNVKYNNRPVVPVIM